MVKRLREIALVLSLLAVAVLVLRANQRRPSELSWFDRAVLWVTAPVESAISSGVRGVARTWRSYVWLVDARTESEQLREENLRLRGELSRARLAEGRVAKLEAMLALRAQVPAETLSARVVGVDTSPFYRVVRVRLDRAKGEVKPNMVVVVPDGVVGRVGRVFDNYCEVLLAIDPDSSIDVQVPRTGARGVLKGASGPGVAGEDVYGAIIPNMPRGDEVQVGDEVVTSGIGGFPRDLAVGKVSRVDKPDSGLWQRVVVSPSVDFARLAEVLIVLSAPPPPDPEYRPDTRRTPLPGRGIGAPR